MSQSTLSPSPTVLTVSPTLTAEAGRIAAYVRLSKLRIGFMAVVAVAVGFALGVEAVWNWGQFAMALVGVGLGAIASSVLNQCLEVTTDARMPRTAERPLPSGQLSLAEAWTYGLACSALSTITLLLFVNGLTAFLTVATTAAYVGLYTPLKRYSPLCTVIGAVPGAMPPVLGWVASGQTLDMSALTLFVLLFTWQFPHFLAIAWIYQDQYRRAGLKMLPANGHPAVVGLIAVGYAAVLIPCSLLLRWWGLAGSVYAATALALGVWYLVDSIRFAWRPETSSARRLLKTSLVYLPVVLVVLTADHLWRLN
ncbi:heme o synthase [Planctomyces sp. SH-PL14]|uniref:heme o synthase n=1 Tax=Planctomyces sp. SH-PL14 TaxID=1632864 RepID=UPI00078B1AC8|nr:heme o synthase [Planctomyces sp. SH-PL14]AMV21956.1 Protoheme IX farnesyltransferase [Planctomyces sp. SH-PL14]